MRLITNLFKTIEFIIYKIQEALKKFSDAIENPYLLSKSCSLGESKTNFEYKISTIILCICLMLITSTIIYIICLSTSVFRTRIV